jgi:hypothetical protein
MRALAAAAVLAVALPAGAAAQAAAPLAVRVGVGHEVLAVAASRALDFGVVVPGVATTVNPRTAVNAGEFEIRGERGVEFTATFVLPAELVLGPHRMPIGFGPQSGCENRTGTGQCSYFDPRVPFTGRISNRPVPRNTYFFRLGGTVTPAAGQQPGRYRGTIVLELAYTGN